MEFLFWLENTSYATWMREADYLHSMFPYTFVLSLHAIGLALLVGPNAAINLRILGFAPSLPLAPMEGFFRLMWVGFWLNAVSGVLLIPTAAVTFFTDPIFYIKLGAIAAAVVVLRLIHREVFRADPAERDAMALSPRAKTLAGTSLVLWAIANLSGRLMAYPGFIRWATLAAFLIVTIVLAIVSVGWFVAVGGGARSRPLRNR